MKRSAVLGLLFLSIVSACSTVQSIIKSTFPYTATITVESGSKAGDSVSFTTGASSLDEIFGNQNSSSFVKDVRVANARVDAVNPSNQSLGVFKTINLYLIGENGNEVMVASRNDIGENIGKNIVLDADNSRLVDDYVKGKVRLRFEYILRSDLTSDVTVRTAINFSALPNRN